MESVKNDKVGIYMDIQFVKNIRQAIKNNDANKVEELIDNDNEKLNAVFVFGSWLHEAAEYGNIDVAKKLLDLGIDTNLEARSFKGSALSSAASAGKIEMIKYLLSRGMKYDVSNTDANPLFCAISANQVDTVQYLINDGIDVNINYSDDENPWRAIEVAKGCGNKQIIKLIEEAMKNNSMNEFKTFNEYIENEIGVIDTTIEGIPLVDNFKMNLNVIIPKIDNGYRILMTDGMGRIKLADNNRVELMVKIPAEWAGNITDTAKQDAYSIYKWLIYLSYIPHKFKCSIVNGLPCPTSKARSSIFKGTEMTSFLYAYPEEEKIRNVNISDKTINLYEILPIYEEEYQLALQKSGEFVIELFKEKNISRIVDWNREKVI